MIIRHLENTHLGRCSLRDIFGIGAATAGVASSAANITSTALTNQANKEIADANNQTQIKIHEDDRAFNAEEAEKTRQWNSEQAVMERRKEAGLNIVNPQGVSGGSGGSGSGATASAPSAPQLVTPTMQAPQIDGSFLSSVIDGFKASSEIDVNKSNAELNAKNAENVAKDTIYKEALTDFQKIVNEYTPNQLRATIDKLTSEKSLNDMQRNLARASISRTLQDAKASIFNVITTFLGQDMTKEEMLQTARQFYSSLESDARKTLGDWRMNGIKMSFDYGAEFQHGFNKGINFGFGSSLTGSMGLGSGSSESSNISTTTGSVGKSSKGGTGGSSVTRGFSVASFLGINSGLNGTLSSTMGYNQGLSNLSKFIQANPQIYEAVRDIFTAEMYSHIDKDKNAVLKSLRAIKSRGQYLQDYFALDAQISNHLLQQEQTFLRSN